VYFDDQLLKAERERLFHGGPRYVGHELAVPELGDFHTLEHELNGRALVRQKNGPALLSNVCRHRQAVMLQGRGNTGEHIVCPLHRWTYSASGQLIGAPHFPSDPCLHLENFPLKNWNGLLFEHSSFDIQAAMAKLGCIADLDFSGYVWHSSKEHRCHYNWKSFVEVYLEDYHVAPFHPGLGNFVSCEDLTWEYGEDYSVQTVGVNRALASAGTPTYRRWHEAVLQQMNGKPLKQGAIWLTIYPNITLEWYPNVLVVSTLHPQGPQETLNLVEFFYPEEIAAFEPDYIQAQQAAYMETCEEDDEIALRMDAGRKALLHRGTTDAGPYQSPMEDGMQHFHEWYRKRMKGIAI
jgi:choline monooxygenase